MNTPRFDFSDYTTFRIVDRFCTPRGNLPTLADALIFAIGHPGSIVEGLNLIHGTWIRFAN
jgi:hypothetical protein